MENSFNISDFGITVFTYVVYCNELGSSAVMNNAAIDKIGEHFWKNESTRKFVSPEMVHSALLHINPELYIFEDEICFADFSQWNKVVAYINGLLRKDAAYLGDVKSWSVERTLRASRHKAKLNMKTTCNTPVAAKELSIGTLQATSLSCLVDNKFTLTKTCFDASILDLIAVEIPMN